MGCTNKLREKRSLPFETYLFAKYKSASATHNFPQMTNSSFKDY